jgi:DNA-binding MarR family transcriptional regulator
VSKPTSKQANQQSQQAHADAWQALSRRYAAVSSALGRELDERHGLSLHEFEVLARLAVDDHEQHRMQELADAAQLTQSALSRLVARLEQEGLVKRSMCDVDRRGIFACLTERGRQRYEEALPTYRAVLAESLAGEIPVSAVASL